MKYPRECPVVSAVLYGELEFFELVDVEVEPYSYFINAKTGFGRLIPVRCVDRKDPECDQIRLNIDRETVRPLTPAARAMLAIARGK